MAAKKVLTDEQKKALADFRRRFGADGIKLQRHKDFLGARKAIRKTLEKQPDTVPALARNLKLSSLDVLRHIAGMRKYGEIRELGEADGYVRYGLVETEPRAKE